MYSVVGAGFNNVIYYLIRCHNASPFPLLSLPPRPCNGLTHGDVTSRADVYYSSSLGILLWLLLLCSVLLAEVILRNEEISIWLWRFFIAFRFFVYLLIKDMNTKGWQFITILFQISMRIIIVTILSPSERSFRLCNLWPYRSDSLLI